MRDADVRKAMLAQLNVAHAGDEGTRIVQEMGVWSGAVRIDIAVINGELSGFELKSDSDTLLRLPYQTEIYGRVFDRVTLVVGRKHYRDAIKLIPRWWGCIVATMDDDRVVLKTKRKGRRNPAPDPHVLAQLLWKPEAVAVLEKCCSARGLRSMRASEITDHLVDALSCTELGTHVRDALKARVKLGQLSSCDLDMSIDAVADPA